MMYMFENYSDIVSIQDLMQMLSIGKNKAYDLIHSGIIKSFRVGNHIRICKKSIITYIINQQDTTPDEYSGMQVATSITM